MLNVSYSVTGAEDVLRELRKFRLDALRPELADILDEIARDAADYPPPNSNYRRTGRLGRGWTGGSPTFPESSATTLIAVLTNSVPYGPYVQGPDDQVSFHAGRWRTTDQIAAAWEDRVAQRVEDALGGLLGASS